MDKPVVFLSHSSKDRRELLALQRLLDKKSVGAIQFFLSSDEESIRPGTLWPEEIKKGLESAHLMFVFISAAAIKSGWTYFETGYGFHKLGHVTPFCLPGIDRAKLPPPLNLLQARNLHSAKDLGALVKECNEAFKTKIPETFNKQEFDRVFASHPEWEVEKPIDWAPLVSSMSAQIGLPESVLEVFALEVFAKVCRAKGLDCDTSGLDSYRKCVVASGVELTTETLYQRGDEYWNASQMLYIGGAERKHWKPIELHVFRLEPRFIHVTFPVLDAWKREVKERKPFVVKLAFSPDVDLAETHVGASRIFRSEVSMLPDGKYKFQQVTFSLKSIALDDDGRFHSVHLDLNWPSSLADLPLNELIVGLFQLGVLEVDKSPKRKSR